MNKLPESFIHYVLTLAIKTKVSELKNIGNILINI